MAWIEDDHPRDENGEFTYKNKAPSSEDGDYDKTMSRLVDIYSSTPAEDKAAMGISLKIDDEEESEIQRKISSVHIDYTKDNVLPELNKDTLQKIGIKEDKKVLLKKNIIDRNFSSEHHGDLTKSDFENILKKVLYRPSRAWHSKGDVPNYIHLESYVTTGTRGKKLYGLVLIDRMDTKEYIEIVHAYYTDDKGLQRAMKKIDKNYII